ncbi:hypothetical protein EFA69_10955 [Rufibacter immobilis]|uniref:Uncharacterized protein n=1 Tax=Rufibacter immobilis TaxID=1348778 RepID=A0A3M9MYY7_9BACT|nr:hypothetical protein [Rufibacter immobilis]RNI30385.1 hypothetical protein EFA69_10955 [Rufibacter immobilis]
MPTPPQLQELFRTVYGAVYQCNRYNCYFVEFAGGISPFKVRDFLDLKHHVDAINVEAMLKDPSRASDVHVLMPYRSERCFVLSLTDVLHFQELLQGAKAMLSLNSILHECLYAPVAY